MLYCHSYCTFLKPIHFHIMYLDVGTRLLYTTWKTRLRTFPAGAKRNSGSGFSKLLFQLQFSRYSWFLSLHIHRMFPKMLGLPSCHGTWFLKIRCGCRGSLGRELVNEVMFMWNLTMSGHVVLQSGSRIEAVWNSVWEIQIFNLMYLL